MQVNPPFTIYQFAEKEGLEIPTVRQMCHQYKTNNGRNQAHLPDGWTAIRTENVKGRFLIYKTGDTEEELLASKMEVLDEAAEEAINKVLTRMLLKNQIKANTSNWENWLADELSTIMREDAQSAAKIKEKIPELKDARHLIRVIGEAYKMAVLNDITVKLEISFQKSGEWSPKPVSPKTVAARLMFRRSPIEIFILTTWHNSIFSFKTGSRRNLAADCAPELNGTCLNCLSRINKGLFCHKHCEGAFTQFIKRTANKYKNENGWSSALLDRLDDNIGHYVPDE